MALEEKEKPPVRAEPQAARAAFDRTWPVSPKVRQWRRLASVSVVAFAVVLIAAIYGLVRFNDRRVEAGGSMFVPPPVVEQAPVRPTVRRAIDGMLVTEGTLEPDYFAVMIDNIAEALPQSGVSKAALVIEAPVEGGITRLFALFTSDMTVEKIGPIRSARPYYLDWAKEYGALYAHVGGSPDALTIIKNSDVRDLNEFFAGASFWRDASRKAPHSTYSSTELLAAAAAKRGTPSPLSPWKFKEDLPAEQRADAPLMLSIGDKDHWHVGWRYDHDTNMLARIVGGSAQKDLDGSPVLAKNIVVQFTTVRVLDDVGRRWVDTTSGGDALAVIDGRVIGARWKKGADGGRTRFYDAAGNELWFNAGTTWIEVVPKETPVTY